MWVWKSLGLDSVTELPYATLGVLGCRCRIVNSNAQSSKTLGADHPQVGEGLRTEKGEALELSPAAVATLTSAPSTTGALAGTWRLEPMGSMRLCLPGAVELVAGMRPTIMDPERASAFPTVKDAVWRLVGRKSGYFVYKVPMVDAHLREDLATDICNNPGPSSLPHCVTGVHLGAMMKITVITGEDQSRANSPQLPPVAGGSDESRFLTVQCGGEQIPFSLRIVQRGGPPIDPSRLHGKDEEGVAKELERWAKKTLVARPDTWRTLNVNAKPAAVDAPQPALRGAAVAAVKEDNSQSFNIASRGGRQLGDIVLAAAANASLALEPFELSYGDAHVCSMRKMLEDEIANVLKVDSEQVRCGDFISRGQGPQKRHLRRDTVTLRFALLNTELVDAVRTKELPRRGGAQRAPTASGIDGVGKSKNAVLDPSSPAPRSNSALGKSSYGSIPYNSSAIEQTQATASGSAAALISVRKKDQLSRSSTEPSLHAGSLKDIGMATYRDKELPPDQLLKMLMAALANPKHALRKHPDVFPMLSRILPNGIQTGAMLVASKDVVRPGTGEEGLTKLRKEVKATRQPDISVDFATLQNLSAMRSEVLDIYDSPEAELLAQKRDLLTLSAKEILDTMEASFALPRILAACLETMVDRTLEDTNFILRLRLHSVVQRVIFVMRRFKSDRNTVLKCFNIIRNISVKDAGCLDRILEEGWAPELIQSLANFPRDQAMQLLGSEVLKLCFLRAREASTDGPRVVRLGKGVDEIWTFTAVRHLLAMMHTFEEDELIQLECCKTLASLGELLYNNGMGKAVFGVLEVAMRRHKHNAEILTCGVLIIARLGPSFLAHEHKGVKTIADAMANHRSCVELQRVGCRALFALTKQTEALRLCCIGGSVTALLLAMGAHSKDPQVLQEATRALEKHCPRALAKVFRICGDVATVMPSVAWSNEPGADAFGGHHFDLSDLKASETWDADLLDNFLGELTAKRRADGGGDDVEERADGSRGGLSSLAEYRRVGLREDMDAEDKFWAVPDSIFVSLASRWLNSAHNVLDHDLNAMKEQGCDAAVLRTSGPSFDQVQKLCIALTDGQAAGYGPQDGEFLATLLGHFAWHSAKNGHHVITNGGAKGFMNWLQDKRWSNEKGNHEEMALAYPMQRACLTGLSSCCRGDEECVSQVLALEAAPLVMDFVGHLDVGIRRAALRCLARLIPHASKRSLKRERVVPEEALPVILRELVDKDELIRTAAAACALEAATDGWVNPTETGPHPSIADLVKALLHALEQAHKYSSASAALPVLLAIGQLTSNEEDTSTAEAFHAHEGLIQVLTAWLPKGAKAGAGGAERGGAAAAASVVCTLTERGAALGMLELGALLHYCVSEHAEPALRESCEGAVNNAVGKENDAALLAQLLANRVEEVRGAGGGEALHTVARRIVQILKDPKGSQEHQASESLVASLDRAENLMPKTHKDKEPSPLLALIMEARSLASVDEGPAESERSAETQLGPSSLANTSGTLPQIGRGRTTSVEAAASRADLSRTSPAIFT